MGDIWSQKTEYYDDGVKFGTGPEMIAEIKSLSRKLEEARGRIAELERKLDRDGSDLPWGPNCLSCGALLNNPAQQPQEAPETPGAITHHKDG